MGPERPLAGLMSAITKGHLSVNTAFVISESSRFYGLFPDTAGIARPSRVKESRSGGYGKTRHERI